MAGLFFLRFWRETRDRLFALFALACFVLAVNRVGLALAAQQDIRGDYVNPVSICTTTSLPGCLAGPHVPGRR